MGVEWNKRLILILIASIVAVAVLLKCISYYRADTELPEPAVINEPLMTHYVGNVALDMPESWKMSRISATFYLTGEKDGPEIEFDDDQASEGQDAVEILDDALDTAERKIGFVNENAYTFIKKDITESLGRPAAIFIGKSKPRRYNLGPQKDASPDLNHLEISLFLAEPQTLLRFTYSENIIWPDTENNDDFIFAQQKALTDWVLAFLPRYHWEGANTSHPGNYLATERGRIAFGDGWPELKYSLTAFFNKEDEDSLNSISLSLDTGPGESPLYSRTNRTVGSHPGHEYKSLTNVRKGLEKLKLWQPKPIFMHLRWDDYSPDPFNEANPKYTVRYMGTSDTKSFSDLAYTLGAWDIMLDSVRTVSEPQIQE